MIQAISLPLTRILALPSTCGPSAMRLDTATNSGPLVSQMTARWKPSTTFSASSCERVLSLSNSQTELATAPE